MKDPNGARGTTDGPRDRVASVVVVEDERIVAKDIQQTLRGLGYDAFAVASSATEVLALVAERRPDVILMDIRIRGSRDGIVGVYQCHRYVDEKREALAAWGVHVGKLVG